MDAVNAQARASHGHRHRAQFPSITAAVARSCMVVAVALCASCATRPAPDITGHWQALNRFDAAPVELPLARPYVFRASPVDRSLRAMLQRWAADANRTLVYAHPSDFSLYRPVANLRTGNLAQAAAELTTLYARQHVVVTVDANTIRVRQADPAVGPAPSPGVPSATTSDGRADHAVAGTQR
jgi:hypothetical protein